MSTIYNDFTAYGLTREKSRGATMSVKEAAIILSKGQNTIIRMCKDGELRSVPTAFGSKTSYRVYNDSVFAMQQLLKEKELEALNRKKAETPKYTSVPQQQLIETYFKCCERGMISGRPHSPSTMKNNRHYLTKFLAKFGEVSVATVKAELIEIPADMFAKREKIWVVTLSFAKWLVNEEYVDKGLIEKLIKLKPKRHKPAKKLSLKEYEIDAMEKTCNNAYERCIVMILSQTGVRSSEFCSWTMQNVNLEDREVKFIGKGNKERWVGLTAKAYEALKTYLELYPPINECEPIFRDKNGKQLHPDGLGHRVRAIGERAGIIAHPHCLRRSFATINVTKGHNLIDLQLALGHSDMKTTRGYIRIEQEETVNRMKDW